MNAPGPAVVDARGQRCPLPVIALARRARDLPVGSRLEVIATDPAARHDIPAWARLRGHVIESTQEAPDGAWHVIVRLAAP